MLAERPLPPVSVPSKVAVGAGVGTSERSVTGMVVTSANAGVVAELVASIAAAWSPGFAGVETVSVTLPDAPGAKVSEFFDSAPNGCATEVVTRNGAWMLDGLPSGIAWTSAVHVPGAGLATWAFP